MIKFNQEIYYLQYISIEMSKSTENFITILEKKIDIMEKIFMKKLLNSGTLDDKKFYFRRFHEKKFFA